MPLRHYVNSDKFYNLILKTFVCALLLKSLRLHSIACFHAKLVILIGLKKTDPFGIPARGVFEFKKNYFRIP